MNKSEIINKCHSSVILYLMLGWILESQRKYLVFVLPTIQFQFLINDNTCILTQLEEKYLIKEKEDDKKEDDEIIYDSFIGTKLKQYNINISDQTRERIIHGFVYGSFLISYYLM